MSDLSGRVPWWRDPWMQGLGAGTLIGLLAILLVEALR